MGPDGITRRWESGALAHAVTDPFGQAPLPWLRGSETCFDGTGLLIPWYVDHLSAPDAPDAPAARDTREAPAVRITSPSPPPASLRRADDVHRQIKGFTSTGAVAPGETIDFRVTVDPPQDFTADVHRIGHYGG